MYNGGISTTTPLSPTWLGNRIPLSSCNITLDLLPPIAWLFNPPVGVPADDDEICFDEGVCVVVETELRVASACFIDGDASGPLDKVGLLRRPEF